MLSSRGIGLPSAVDEAREVDDVFCWKSGGKGKVRGKDPLLDLTVLPGGAGWGATDVGMEAPEEGGKERGAAGPEGGEWSS